MKPKEEDPPPAQCDQCWACPKCTLDNPKADDVCGACAHPRPPHVEAGGPATDAWACPKCTLENPKAVAACQACAHARPPQPTKTKGPKAKGVSRSRVACPGPGRARGCGPPVPLPPRPL